MKITLVISSLSCGGAERVLVSLAQGLLQRGYDVSIITLASIETDFYTVPPKAFRLALNIATASANWIQAIGNNLSRLSILRRAILSTQPDVVISFLISSNVLSILSTLDRKIPVIITIHNDPRVHRYGKFWSTLRRWVYPYSSKVVSVSKGVDSWFNWLPERQKKVIYNPFLKVDAVTEIIDLPPGINPEKQWILSMGRLSPQKGFDILLNAFAKIAEKYPDWQLIILGKGELKQQLEQQKDNLGLGQQVVFPGAVKDPFSWMKRAQFFVMSSRFEGFPMAHGEALSCGLPVIATNCPSGPAEIIRDGVDGLLVPNEDTAALAQAIEHLMTDQDQRSRLASRAPEVTDRFGLETVLDDWEKLITEVTTKALVTP